MRRISVLGLGYVGLPVSVALARAFPGVIAYDRDAGRVERLRRGEDETRTVAGSRLLEAKLTVTDDERDLAESDFYVVAVPTPIDEGRRPDLSALEDACVTVGRALAHGDVVVFESTVYPGATEQVCVPILERESGLRLGDFAVGYSPERINPGDEAHVLERVVKVVAASDAETLELVAEVYGAVVPAGVHRAPSIRVAEAAKVIENVQRDLNVALMNELAVLFDRMGLDTNEVLDAAATKWNFHRYHPGLVGGHCIGVDPYYLTAVAEAHGVDPRIVLAGREINDGMGAFVAARTLDLLRESGRDPRGARAALLGLTFKRDVGDTRNSRVPAIAHELRRAGVDVFCHDPLADPRRVADEYGIELVGAEDLVDLDAVVLATPHAELVPLARDLVASGPRLLVDVLSALRGEELPDGVRVWSL